MEHARIVKFFGILLGTVFLAACNSENKGPPPAPSSQSVAAVSANAKEGKHVAVSYGFSLRLPGNEIPGIHQKHLSECRRLGCEVLSTGIDQSTKGRVHARSAVRIPPLVFPEFENKLSAPPAEVVLRTETSEDKTLPLLDVEKRLGVKQALRDRLTAMIREPGEKSIADIAAIERQISDIQGEIESATAQRDYLRTITETVRVDIEYSSITASAGGVNFSPIADALKGSIDTFIESTASVIVFAIAIAPWIPLAALALWAIRRFRRRSRLAPGPA